MELEIRRNDNGYWQWRVTASGVVIKEGLYVYSTRYKAAREGAKALKNVLAATPWTPVKP